MDQYHAQSSLKKVEELQRIARQEQATSPKSKQVRFFAHTFSSTEQETVDKLSTPSEWRY